MLQHLSLLQSWKTKIVGTPDAGCYTIIPILTTQVENGA